MPSQAHVLNESKVIGRQPEDRYANIRKECYEELVRTAKRLSKFF